MFLPQFQAAGNPGVDGGDKEKEAVMTLGRTQAVGAGEGGSPLVGAFACDFRWGSLYSAVSAGVLGYLKLWSQGGSVSWRINCIGF